MHSLNNCPLRTFACITTTNTFPFYILALDDAALDLFLTGPNSPTAEQRTAACLALKGKTIAQVLLNDNDSCLEDTTTFNDNCDVIQPYVIAKDLLFEASPSTRKRTRRVHACIHSVTQSSPSLSPSSTTEISTPLVPLSPDQDNLLPTESRLYVLKDVTEIQGLAQAAQADIRMRLATQQPRIYRDQEQDQGQESDDSISSSTSSTPPSSPTTPVSPCSLSSVFLSSTTTTASCTPPSSPSLSSPLLSSSRSSVILLDSKPSSLSYDWSGKVPSRGKAAPASPSMVSSQSPSSALCSSCATCSTGPSSLPHTTSTALSHHHQECSHTKSLLLLQVTRFGTVDHAFTIPQISSSAIDAHLLDTCQHSESIHALSNTSAMSYAHPDDLRLFCQGLDKTCKSLYHVFRVRWRKSGLGPALKGLEDKDDCKKRGLIQGGSSRTIEFQGELFEEWVDPTAMSLAAFQSSPRDVDNYLWTEITGVLSNTQPLLVVRPLTSTEVQEQEKLQGQLKMMHISSQQARSEKTREMLHRQWRNKSKNMGLEEGRVPKQSSLSALTSLSIASCSSSTLSLSSLSSTCSSMSSMSSTSDMELARSGSHFRMPGSLPPTTRCRASATANELMGMPSVLAFPTASAPWSVLTGIAVDAWNQWIMIVHAGQAQFQDWCVYVLELTVEQLIESFSLGMTLIGGRTDDHQQEPLTEFEHEHMTSRRQSLPSSMRLIDQEEPRLSGLQRAGKVLEEYPSLSGVVQIFGNSWLGQKLRGKLEQKLNKVADQVVDWWEQEPSPPCSPDASSASSVLNMAPGSVTEPLFSSE
ncbi:hypothetical protein BGZ93_001252 [Podila epicladia]|nr:hypothetical protein BGZ92_008595 [Podila epicladia]KAG0098054.1 hypothetical protein BGZ93_001252 [Podila epicladia]